MSVKIFNNNAAEKLLKKVSEEKHKAELKAKKKKLISELIKKHPKALKKLS